VGCEGLRLAREDVFRVFRPMPVALFLERRRVFSATALAWKSRLSLTIPRKLPKKYAPGLWEHDIGGLFHYETSI
jgi:hypothetical protein